MSIKSVFIVPEQQRPEWLDYPSEYLSMVAQGWAHLRPWHLLEAHYAVQEHGKFVKTLHRWLMPFAYRQDNDDLACFEKGHGNEVKIIHNQTAAGYENVDECDSFADWLQAVEAEAADWQQ